MRAYARGIQSNYLPQCGLCEGPWPSELHLYVRVCACVRVRALHVCVHACIYGCVHACVCALCTCACECVCACACVCACVVHVRACVYSCVRTSVRALCICVCVCTYTCVRTCVHARTCVCVHVKRFNVLFLLVSFLHERARLQAVCPPLGP